MTIRLAINDSTNTYYVKILEEREYTIGRSSTCNIVVEDENISSKHCVVKLFKDTISISDLDSKNGTFLNGVRISNSENKFNLEDIITLGNTFINLNKENMSHKELGIFTLKDQEQKISEEITKMNKNIVFNFDDD